MRNEINSSSFCFSIIWNVLLNIKKLSKKIDSLKTEKTFLKQHILEIDSKIGELEKLKNDVWAKEESARCMFLLRGVRYIIKL